MILESDAAIGASLVAIAGGIGALFIKLFSLVSDFAKLELKVNTLWDFLMNRSLAQGLDHGIITMNSPISATENTEAFLEPLMPEIMEFYKTKGKTLDDRDLFIEIEKLFGDRICREICIPQGTHQGACILAAIAAAKKREKESEAA